MKVDANERVRCALLRNGAGKKIGRPPQDGQKMKRSNKKLSQQEKERIGKGKQLVGEKTHRLGDMNP